MSGQRLARDFWIPFGFLSGATALGGLEIRIFDLFGHFCGARCRHAALRCAVGPLHALQVASQSDFGLDFGPGKLHFGMQFLILQRCLYSFVFLSLFRRFLPWQCCFGSLARQELTRNPYGKNQ